MMFRMNALVILLSCVSSSAFVFPSVQQSQCVTNTKLQSAVEAAASLENAASKTSDPLLIRAAKGQKTERTPVWMSKFLVST